MSNRITMKQLESLVNRLNEATESPVETYTNVDGVFKANIGNYHLDSAYGGHKLSRICTDGGGVSDVLSMGFCSKRECYDRIYAFIRGIESKGK